MSGAPMKRNISGRSKAIGAIIFIIIVIVIIAAVLYWNSLSGQDDVKYLEAGCEPKAWDSWGQVSLWACPPGVQP